MRKLFLSFLLICFFLIISGCNSNTTNTINNGLEKIKSEKELLTIIKSSKDYYPNIMLNSTEKSNNEIDYSQTNTQVEGIDEADIVKSDGNYIFMPQNQNIIIAKAYPVQEMTIVKTIVYEDGFYPFQIYVDDKYLVVIGNIQNEKGFYTRVIVYDKTNYNKPKDKIDIDGFILDSRKIGNDLVLVTNTFVEPNPKRDKTINYPSININNINYDTKYNEIYYKEGTIPQSFISIYKFSLDELEISIRKYTILGQAGTLYVSKDHVYIAQMNYPTRISDEKSPQNTDEGKTNLTRISINEENFGSSNTTKLIGYIHNQFSMDEYEGMLRVATTSGGMATDDTLENHLYIFDKKLNLISNIDKIAKGERIQSVRFLANRIYLVTFRQIDPFFVIDVSNPKKSNILGELKLSGYSTYLHPYDDDHIIGFGFETTSDENPRNVGLKLTLFNVKEPQNPRALFNEVIEFGDNGYAHSELSYNHKALLFNKDKNLIAFPFNFNKFEMRNGYYHHYYRQSFRVYNINPLNGFTYRADISHFDGLNTAGETYNYEILRGLYIEDTLYTVSNSEIQAYNLNNLKRMNKLNININNQILIGTFGDYSIYKDITPRYFAQALEKIFEDDNYNYYLPCICSSIYEVKNSDDEVWSIQDTLIKNLISITDLETVIKIYKYEKEKIR